MVMGYYTKDIIYICNYHLDLEFEDNLSNNTIYIDKQGFVNWCKSTTTTNINIYIYKRMLS